MYTYAYAKTNGISPWFSLTSYHSQRLTISETPLIETPPRYKGPASRGATSRHAHTSRRPPLARMRVRLVCVPSLNVKIMSCRPPGLRDRKGL